MSKMQSKVSERLMKCGLSQDNAEKAIIENWHLAVARGCETTRQYADAIFYIYLADA